MKITGITVYELLGLIKNGQAPKKIIFDRDEYLYDQELEDYRNVKVNFRCYLIGAKYHETGWLNKEVAIILEPKSINDISPSQVLTKIENNFTGYKMYADGKEVMSIETGTQENKIPEKIQKDDFEGINEEEPKLWIAIRKINEIIDYLKTKGE